MAYDVYPYSYRNLRFATRQTEDVPDVQQEQKRGDLEGYLAAKDFASQAYSTSVSSNAQANIRRLNNLRPDISLREYINILIKQGQVPEKHFKYRKSDENEIITELNSNKDIVKQVIFDSNPESSIPVTSKYYNPDIGIMVKEVHYHKNGFVDTKTFYADSSEDVPQEDLQKSDEILNNATVPLKTDNPFLKLNNS